MKSYIYGLCSPDNETVMYVGKTYHPEKRLVQHLTAARDQIARPVYDWIRKLQSDGKVPTMVILEEVTSGRDARREAAWIKHFKSQNAELKNAPHGRLGGRKLHPDGLIVKWESDAVSDLINPQPS